MRMNSPLGKKILATVRDADYAHAGESEAIEMVFAPLVKDARRTLLDAGCGRCGTAAYVQRGGWGRVSGFDVDAASIAEARGRYPELDLRVADATTAADAFTERFDVAYALNAFYAFPDQPSALRSLRQLVGERGELVLFDYVDRGGFAASALGRHPEAGHWRPLRLPSLADDLAAAGWHLESVVPMHAEYERWYAAFVARIEAKKDEIAALAGEDAWQPVYDFYRALHESVCAGALGGATVYAVAR